MREDQKWKYLRPENRRGTSWVSRNRRHGLPQRIQRRFHSSLFRANLENQIRPDAVRGCGPRPGSLTSHSRADEAGKAETAFRARPRSSILQGRATQQRCLVAGQSLKDWLPAGFSI